MRLVSIAGESQPGWAGRRGTQALSRVTRTTSGTQRSVCMPPSRRYPISFIIRTMQAILQGPAGPSRHGEVGRFHLLADRTTTRPLAGYSFENRNAYDGISEEVLSAASFGNFASSYAGYQYANLRGYQRSVSAERGVTASVVSRYFSKAFGATLNRC